MNVIQLKLRTLRHNHLCLHLKINKKKTKK